MNNRFHTSSSRITFAVHFAIALSIVLLCLCSSPAAWSRGGGGFGGFGGGGGHYGGGWSGYHGGYYGGGGYNPGFYGGGYYGGYGYHHYYGGGYSSSADSFFSILIILAVVLFLIYPLLGNLTRRKTLVVVTLVLGEGQDYTSLFHSFTSRAQLNSPSSRTATAHELVHLIRESDILIGHFQNIGSSYDGGELGRTAKAIWQKEMSVGQIKADVINVSTPGQKMRADFGTPEFDSEATAIGSEGYCLVSIIAAASGFWPSSSTDRAASVSAVHRLGSATIDGLYFYFTPSAGTAISRNVAITLLEQLGSRY